MLPAPVIVRENSTYKSETVLLRTGTLTLRRYEKNQYHFFIFAVLLCRGTV